MKNLRLLLSVVGLWLASAAIGWAQPAPPPSTASQPTPVTEPKVTASPVVPSPSSSCPDRPSAGLSTAGDILLTLDWDTLWRPRGGEIHFKLSKPGSTIAVQKVQVCLGWSRSPAASPQWPSVVHDLLPAPIVRPIASDTGGASYGAVVPDLTPVPNPWLQWGETPDVSLTAFNTVPVADLVVAVTLADGKAVELLLPVGITSVTYAASVVTICLTGFLIAAWLLSGRSPTFILKLISSSDQYASLSQFQILLWTVTIGASAIYVMVLSGNLINLTNGTLVLLGIASATALTARLQSRNAERSGGDGSPKRAQSKWSDLVVIGDTVDLTRVQMLVFTLITAAFVSLKVVTGYLIPEIPTNFLLLMGISNGVYITGRQVPTQADASVKAGIN